MTFKSINIKMRAGIVLLFLFTPLLYSQKNSEVFLEINPNPVIIGKNAELQLVSKVGYAEILALPEIPGIKWSKKSPMSSFSRNMMRRESIFKTIYSFSITKEGQYVIPSIKIKMGHLEQETSPLNFKAVQQKIYDTKGNEFTIDELIYISALLMNKRDYVYVGEEIPLQIRLYWFKGLPLTWDAERMEVDVENILMKDYSKINPNLPSFSSIVKNTIKEDGKEFNQVILKGTLRSISVGNLQGTITIPARVSFPRRFPENMNISTELSSKKVKPLPPVLKGSSFLGLVGEWNLDFHLSKEKLKAGDPVTLTVKLKGKGSLDTLNPPELKIKGFSIFPPEINKKPITSDIYEEGEILYTIIPKESGEKHINFSLSTFSPIKEKYIAKSFSRIFDIEKSDEPSNGIIHDTDSNQDFLKENALNKRKKRNDILYLKTGKRGTVKIPLIDNKLLLIIIFFLIGPAVLIVSELFLYQKRKLSNDPLLKRKYNAKSRKGKVMNKLKSAEGKDELHEIIQNDITPLVNDLFGYPPGTSTDELAEKVVDPKLSACLKSGSSSSYMPGNNAEFNSESLKLNLIKAMRKLPLILLLLFPLSICASDLDKTNLDNTNQDPVALYNKNDFTGAEKLFKEKLEKMKPDPSILYNLGNCAYKKGNLPKALLYYERARRLAPSDSDILENLNFVRRELTLPEIGNSQNPIDSIENFRDSFRSDTWVFLIALTWSLCWLSILARRFISNRKWISSLVISGIFLILSIVAYISQKNTTYNPDRALIIDKFGAELYSLPLESEKTETKLRAGYEVTIEEKRHEWYRVRDENSEGWVKSQTVKRLWPY